MPRISNSPAAVPTRAAAAPPAAAPQPAPKPAATLQPSFDASYWSAIDALAQRAPTQATDVGFLREPQAAWDARLQLVRDSRTSVMGSLYIVNADEKGFQLFEELIAARKRGVDVCVGIDGIAHLVTSLDDKRPERKKLAGLIEELQKQGGVVAWAGTLDDQAKNPGAGIHTKALVSDNRVAIFGGRNISDEYYGEWTDFDTRLEGPVVKQLGQTTLDLLRSCDATPLPLQRDSARDANAKAVMDRLQGLLDQPQPAGGPAPTRPPVDFRLVSFDPLEDGKVRGEKDNRVTQALVETVKRARSEILLSSNMVSPAPELRQALVDAAQRGVKVKLVTSGPEAISKAVHGFVELGYGDLLKAGCEIWETRHHEHGKMYVVDGQLGAYGSYNASDQADRRNAEALLFTSDRRVVDELRKDLEQTLSGCTLYDKQPSSFLSWLFHAGRKIFGG